ncbi:MAG: hypothetical protein JXR72_03055 [Proteobacteria bacterium]|nr:hypothetical protein [Pseudomonadota bacterium]
MHPKGSLTAKILLILFLAGMTSGCAFMDRMRSREPAANPSEPAMQVLQERTFQLEDLEQASSGRIPVELARARIILEEMVYFFGKQDYPEVLRLDALLGQSFDSIRWQLEAGGDPLILRIEVLEEENRGLRSANTGKDFIEKGLKEEIRNLKALSRFEAQSLSKRLAAAEMERDNAIREVVRTRSRIEGLASEAGASAMHAEARVLVDRMREEAFNLRARELLKQSQTYLESGETELKGGNPGGAAYLFDLVSGLFEEFKNCDPGRLTVTVERAALRKSASPSSAVVGSLPRGSDVQGVRMLAGWFEVSDSSGRTGWIRKEQAR